jgi:hypothetical protein
LTLKVNTKGERVLRIEAVVHDARELRCGRSLFNFARLVAALKSSLKRLMDALSCIDQCFIADDLLERLPAASRVGKTKVGGIDLNKQRMRQVAEALIALSASATASRPPSSRLEFAHSANRPNSSTAPAAPLTI